MRPPVRCWPSGRSEPGSGRPSTVRVAITGAGVGSPAMETPGNDEPSPTAEPGAPTTPPVPPPSAASGAGGAPPSPPTPPGPPAGASSAGEPRDLGESVHAAVDDVEAIFDGGLDGEWP